MKKQVKIWVIALLACVGLILIASEPIEDVGWFVSMLWKFVAGLCCWGVCALLYKLWVRYE